MSEGPKDIKQIVSADGWYGGDSMSEETVDHIEDQIGKICEAVTKLVKVCEILHERQEIIELKQKQLDNDYRWETENET